jgi:hypothetical protein
MRCKLCRAADLREAGNGQDGQFAFRLVKTSGMSLPIPIPRNRFAVREENVAALVDGAGFQFGAGAAEAEGGGAAAAIRGRRFANRSTIS